MSLKQRLQARQEGQGPIRVGLVGAGQMGAATGGCASMVRHVAPAHW